MIESWFYHHDLFECEYEYRCTEYECEYEYDCPGELLRHVSAITACCSI